MTDSSMRVLVVGASGNLGLKIVKALAGNAKVRATSRAGSKPERVEALRVAGAEVVTADLGDEASLDRACAGVEVVVSAVQGLRDVIVDGQTRLLNAAARAGVARFVPSDYSLDFFKLDAGENRNLDLRREFHRALDGSKVRGTAVLNGAFMDLLLGGFLAPDASGRMTYWGSDAQLYDFTSTDDTARYTAAVALDRDAPSVTRVAADSVSPNGLRAVFEQVQGRPITMAQAGSVDDLKRALEEMKARDTAQDDTFPRWQQMQYAHNMASGRGKFDQLDNARYAAVKPQRAAEYLIAHKR